MEANLILRPTIKQQYIIFGFALIVSHYLIFSQFFPNDSGRLGHDYALFLPALLDGAYWQTNNGPFSIQWFTPAFCGGLPKFANPNAAYLSVPQFLTFFVSPLSSVKITLFVFAGFGYVGAYLLMRRTFLCSRPVALLVAALFMFNGMYAYRMAIGHLTYHGFMLVPLVALFIIPRLPNKHQNYNLGLRLLSRSIPLIFAALCLSYMLYSGMVNLIIPAMLGVVSIWLLSCFIKGSSYVFASGLINLIAACFSALQLSATMSFLSQFPRDLYTLPGYPNIFDILAIIFQSLFVEPAWQLAADSRVNAQWALGRHELEFGLSFIPVLVFISYLVFNKPSVFYLKSLISIRRLYFCALLVIVVCIPIGVVFYTESWNAILKDIPVLKSSSTLVRWFSMYVPLFAVLSGLLLQKTEGLREFRQKFVFFAVLTLIFLQFSTNQTYYHDESFDPVSIEQRYDELRVGAFRPEITKVGSEDLVRGVSRFQCYEPMFGYRLELYPKKSLQIGSVYRLQSDFLNMKNPACYMYPKENNCEPGDHFNVGDKDQLDNFVNYRPFDFEISTTQRVANAISLASILLSFLVYVVYVCIKLKGRY